MSDVIVVKNDVDSVWHRFRDYEGGRTNVRCGARIEPGRNQILGGDGIPRELMVRITEQQPLLCSRCF